MGQADTLAHATWLLERSGDAALVTDTAGTIEYVNPAFQAMTGYARDEVLGRTPSILKSGRQPQEFYRRLWATLRAGKEFRGVIINRRRDGGLFHEEKSIRPLFDTHGAISHFIATGRDVSQRIAALEQLRHEATHDALTGLPNRTLFLDRLQQALSHAARSGERIAVAMIDLDGFKSINDELGHAAGDAALCAVAQRLCGCIREADTAARLGGDEFVLMLRDAGDAARVTRAVVESCARPVVWDGGASFPVSVSVGVSGHGSDAKTLLEQADQAMYRAKREGGGRSRHADATSGPPAPLGWHEPHDSALGMLEREVEVLRRTLRRGDVIYRAGDRFRGLHILRVGICKLFGTTPGGREELTTVLFKGDWLGFDGLADGRHACTALAADTGELWTVRYDALLRAGAHCPQVMALMHAALARQSVRERDGVLLMHSLPADARVAAFLCRWADELEHVGLRSDQITLPATRSEIGSHVGLRLESVSRAMTLLEREELIRFGAGGRRDIEIPDLGALRDFVRRVAEEAP
ncbi:diguanylate cyclase domain-containing protein [Caldimonas sp. KR1-144]|uniref:diguanylate cyclase domain-containing protein n=1 Tax=Caldimonas sp. KR1-144 TaxID=3400911 RepID=UPI003C020E47